MHLVGFTTERQLQVCSTFLPALVQPALHFAFLRVLGVTSGIKIKEKKSRTSQDILEGVRSVNVFRKLEQVFETYRVMFREMKGKRSSPHHNVYVKKKTPTSERNKPVEK